MDDWRRRDSRRLCRGSWRGQMGKPPRESRLPWYYFCLTLMFIFLYNREVCVRICSCCSVISGLNRCGKSCRLRWLNYLRPGIKRGNISPDEEELIIKLHKLLGNRLSGLPWHILPSPFLFLGVSLASYLTSRCRWSLIAGRLPGRTGYEIKNYWNTILGKKARNDKNRRLGIQHHPDLPRNKMNTKLQQEDDTTGILHNTVQSSVWEKETLVSPAAFWAAMLKCSEMDINAQVSIQHNEQDNYCLDINNGGPRPVPPFGGDTAMKSENIEEAENYRSTTVLLSGFHRGEDAGENAAEDPVMDFDFGDVFLSDLLNSNVLVGSNPSSLSSSKPSTGDSDPKNQQCKSETW